MTRRLFEGLKVGDLKNLVRPLVSIDEYESKLGDDSEVAVVAFFVDDQDPATDLNRFIERSEITILDSEVSPAPNEDGYYLVFVELARDEKFPKAVMDLIESITGLVGDLAWKFKPYGHSKLEDLSAKKIKELVTLDPNVILRRRKKKEEEEARKAEAERKAKQAKKDAEKAAQAKAEQDQAAEQPAEEPAEAPEDGEPAESPDEQPADKPEEEPAEAPAEEPAEVPAEVPAEGPEEPAEEPAEEPEEQPEATPKKPGKAKESRQAPVATRLYEFFQPSLVETLTFNPLSNRLVFSGQSGTWDFTVVGIGRLDRLMERCGLVDRPFELSPESISACRRLAARLGHAWEVQKTGDLFIVAHGDHGVVLRDD